MRLIVSPLLSNEATANPTDRSRSPSWGRLGPGTRAATRWSNSVDLPAPPGPTRTTLRMSSGVRGWAQGLTRFSQRLCSLPHPVNHPMRAQRGRWGRSPAWSGPGGRHQQVLPRHVRRPSEVAVAEVGEGLVELGGPRRVVGDVAVGGDGRAVVGLEEVAELRAGRRTGRPAASCGSAVSVGRPGRRAARARGPRRPTAAAAGPRAAAAARYGFMVANICPMKPSGVQLSRPIVPPGRQTRTSSSAAGWWCGANMTPTHEMTASNSPSSNGRCSASATCQLSVEALGLGALAAGLEQLGREVAWRRRRRRRGRPGWRRCRSRRRRRGRARPARCRPPRRATGRARR